MGLEGDACMFFNRLALLQDGCRLSCLAFLYLTAITALAQERLDCWGDGSYYTYNVCCGCGNEAGSWSGVSDCWSGDLQQDSCCGFYGNASALPNIPCWRDASGPKTSINVMVAGRKWILPQHSEEPSSMGVGDVFSYVLWPSAYALAAWLEDKPLGNLAGLRVLELACGVGLPSLIGASHGAHVLATDIDSRSANLTMTGARKNLRVRLRR